MLKKNAEQVNAKKHANINARMKAAEMNALKHVK
jgi:hypothetical protein